MKIEKRKYCVSALPKPAYTFLRSFYAQKRFIFIFQAILFTLLFITPFAYAGYKRIVSLAPLITESLYELGIDCEISAITVYCPKGKFKKEIIGTLLEPDVEKIVMLNPDLIIATKEGNNKGVVEKFIRMGYEVHVMETSSTFAEICGNFYDLAVKTGKEKEALNIISDAKNKIENIYEEVKSRKTQSVFWEIGARPLYTAGKRSFVNYYNYYTNTLNVYRDLDMRYAMIDIEDVIIKNPDIIALVDMGDVNKEEIENWQKYKTLAAVQNEKIFMIGANDIFTPTPSTFAKGVGIFAGLAYPEIFDGTK